MTSNVSLTINIPHIHSKSILLEGLDRETLGWRDLLDSILEVTRAKLKFILEDESGNEGVRRIYEFSDTAEGNVGSTHTRIHSLSRFLHRKEL